MKKKVLLVTLEGLFNFGNRLQHYALQTAIENCGYQVDSLMVKKQTSNTTKTILKQITRLILATLGNENKKCSYSKKKRTLRFMDFNDKLIHKTIRMPVEQVRSTNWEQYTYAVTGSDQVWHNWHTKIIPNELSYYYLEFIDRDKRVSYAPSFGFTAFPKQDLEAHRRGLNGIHALSCREQEGCELIHELTGREAEKVLDPTLLLTDEDWITIERKPSFYTPNKYMLQFFLGEITQEYKQESDRIAEERMIEILDVNNPLDYKHYAISPDEFIWLVHHAVVVCTDSFHATAFSIIFGRDLRVFKRKQDGFEEMFGRIHDLLNPLGLMGVVYGEGNDLSTKLSEEGKDLFRKEREESLEYLRKSLNTKAVLNLDDPM